MYLLVIRGKGTSFYRISVSRGQDVANSYIMDTLPFQVELFSALKVSGNGVKSSQRAEKIRDYLHRYFANSQTNDDWFDLSPCQAKQLRAMLDDPDNLLSSTDKLAGDNRSIALLSKWWERIDGLAQRTKSYSQKGNNLHETSWQVLIERIAQKPDLLALIERELSNVGNGNSRKYQQPIIVRPEDPETETLAWLRVDGDRVSVVFPEKHDDFKEIVKGMSYTWNQLEWERIIGSWAGDPAHRVAELGQKLLANGFSVVFPDESIREIAVSGGFTREYRRWVLVRDEGRFKGWFVLWWQWSEDCYDAAKQITASQYSKPDVVVPPEQFAEVIDFASIHKFRFSQTAFELVARAKAMKESAMVVSISEKEEFWSDEDLNIPRLDWEDEDLADDIDFDGSPDTAD